MTDLVTEQIDPVIDGELRDLVTRFSRVLLDNLRAAEVKHRWRGKWKRDLPEEELRHFLKEHVEKGDPVDVAALAMFAWHHGYSLSEGGQVHDRPRH